MLVARLLRRGREAQSHQDEEAYFGSWCCIIWVRIEASLRRGWGIDDGRAVGGIPITIGSLGVAVSGIIFRGRSFAGIWPIRIIARHLYIAVHQQSTRLE